MLTAVAKCSRCAAVVNTHWKTCLVCHAPIEAGTPYKESYPPHANDGNVPMPGWDVRWQRGDGSQAQGKVIEVLVDPSVDPPVVVLVKLHDGSEATLNPRVVKLWGVGGTTEKTRGKQR